MSGMNNIYHFQEFEEYLQELERGMSDKRTDRQTNRLHKHFSTSLPSVKNNTNDAQQLFSKEIT